MYTPLDTSLLTHGTMGVTARQMGMTARKMGVTAPLIILYAISC